METQLPPPTDTRPAAILVAHGQPSAPAPAEAALSQLTQQVQAELPHTRVLSATLAMPGRLEQVCEQAGADALVYPCFMARGWFTNQVLPKRLAGRSTRTTDPLGSDPDLPAMVARFLQAEVEKRGWALPDTDLLLAAHGSARGNSAAEAAYGFAEALSAVADTTRITVGFVEQRPFVTDAAGKCGTQTMCLPFFAQQGDHVRNDITKALQDAGFAGDLLPVVGLLPEIPALIAAGLRRAFDT
ncbi:cobalamin biosynthesis protein CbiX [Rhodobacteraceae bacterium M382]|nr:cobalamin biosynthesis protein CbiX [Rhodobacteraceae bacterium M382]